jgi:hypothetical protein
LTNFIVTRTDVSQRSYLTVYFLGQLGRDLAAMADDFRIDLHQLLPQHREYKTGSYPKAIVL